MQRDVLAFYDDFVAKVAYSRKLPVADVAPHAEGRVWSGVRALSLKLVDELGTLEDAIQHAKSRAGFSKDAKIPLITLGRAPRRGLGMLAGAGAESPAQAVALVGGLFPKLAAELAPLLDLAACEGPGPLCLLPYQLDLK